MKLSLKAGEHLRIEHDGGLGFQVYVEGRILHVRAKGSDESYGLVTNIVTEAGGCAPAVSSLQRQEENEGWLVK